MGIVESLLGCSLLEITRSYWAVKLDTGKWVCEAHPLYDLRKGTTRLTDWTNDLVATGDITHVKEVWLLCPSNRLSPLGNTAMFSIERPGSAFQFKYGTADSAIVGPTTQTMQAHIIGKVLNSQGECECYVWDTYYQVLGTGWKTNILREEGLGTWRTGMFPIGKLDLIQLGVQI